MTTTTKQKARPGELVFGLVLAGLGVLALTQVWAIPGGDGWSVAGPRFVPLLVCSAWVVLAALYVGQAARRMDQPSDRGFDPTALLLMVTLVGYAYIVIPLGYVLSTALSFVVTARVLGSRKLVRDIVVGVLMAVVVYFAFTELLSIRLPRGVLPL